jgi:hypothetical protein
MSNYDDWLDYREERHTPLGKAARPNAPKLVDEMCDVCKTGYGTESVSANAFPVNIVRKHNLRRSARVCTPCFRRHAPNGRKS